MNPLDVLVSLDRVRSRVPATLTAGARRLTHSAIRNALSSTEEIRSSVEERRLLARSLEEDTGPGTLSRLSRTDCYDLLATRSIGRLAYIARAGVPDIVPVNYVIDGPVLLIRTATGPKLQAAERGDVVAFEVDELDEVLHRGWSVSVIGRASRLAAEHGAGRSRQGTDPWATGPRRHLICITPDRIEGRRLS